MLILKKKDIIQHVDLNEDLIPIIEEAFISLSKGKTVMPPIMRIDIEKYHGESDVKAAYVEGLDSFAIKIASGFFDNPKLGLPSSNGLMVLLDSKTGVIKSVLLDEGYLTDTRTAIAGAIASKYLSNQDANSVGIIDSGYRGNLGAKFDEIEGWVGWESEDYHRLLQICSGTLKPFRVVIVDTVEELNKYGDTERGEAGFGSTGNV